jgi:hypothetical protein
MELIEIATKIRYETDVKHKHIRPYVPKKRITPPPHRYSEGEEGHNMSKELKRSSLSFSNSL